MNEEVQRYVEAERERGVAEESIRHALIAKKWDYKLVEDVLTLTRPGPAGTLFTRSFFHFAFGFITVISVAVGLILVIGTLSQEKSNSGCVANCESRN